MHSITAAVSSYVQLVLLCLGNAVSLQSYTASAWIPLAPTLLCVLGGVFCFVLFFEATTFSMIAKAFQLVDILIQARF